MKLFPFSRKNWRWICINLFVPFILFIQIFNEMPNILKFISDKANSFISTPKVSTEIDNNKKTTTIQTRVSESSIKTKAEKISVKIVSSKGVLSSGGSGFILNKIVQSPRKEIQKYKYHVLTNSHILNDSPNNSFIKILTWDKKEYTGKLSEPVQSLKGYDLQVISFESNQEYEVAIISKSTQIDRWDRVYIFGYPYEEKSYNSHKFVTGNIGMLDLLPNATKLTKGYSVPYTNETESGMSGSPVLNSKAEVIAIHGLGKNAEPDILSPENSPYLLSNEDQLSPDKKEVAKFFSWGINLTIIGEELLKASK
jgi:S1-C subfamily serine protease